VRGVLIGLQKEHLIQPGDAVVVIKEPDGKVHLDQAQSLTAAPAAVRDWAWSASSFSRRCWAWRQVH
jgi:uncharacterized membrane protein